MSIENNIKKRKCVCISCFNHYETRICHVRKFLEGNGIETIYITSDFDHFGKKRYKADYYNSRQVHVIDYNKNISISRILSHYQFAKGCYRLLDEIKPDIVYCMFPPNLLVKKIIEHKNKANCLVVFDGYDMWPETMPVNTKFQKLFSLLFKGWANLRDKYIEESDLVVAVSSAMATSVSKKWPKVPVKLFLPGVSPANLPSYSSDISNQISFCYLGNINHITDIDLIVEVLGKIRKEKKVLLHIIGAGQNLDLLLKKANNEDIECIVHGVIMDEKSKKEIYEKCNLGINMPREEIQSGMSLKSVEYMAVGLPYLNTGICDNWEIVEKMKVGINIRKTNIDDCVKNILSLKGDDLEEMRMNCLNYTKNKFESQDMHSIFKEIL